jgi:hypothetical protein
VHPLENVQPKKIKDPRIDVEQEQGRDERHEPISLSSPPSCCLTKTQGETINNICPFPDFPVITSQEVSQWQRRHGTMRLCYAFLYLPIKRASTLNNARPFTPHLAITTPLFLNYLLALTLLIYTASSKTQLENSPIRNCHVQQTQSTPPDSAAMNRKPRTQAGFSAFSPTIL